MTSKPTDLLPLDASEKQTTVGLAKSALEATSYAILPQNTGEIRPYQTMGRPVEATRERSRAVYEQLLDEIERRAYEKLSVRDLAALLNVVGRFGIGQSDTVTVHNRPMLSGAERRARLAEIFGLEVVGE